jgi:hypothetical protein
MDRVEIPMSGAEKRREIRMNLEKREKFNLKDLSLVVIVIIAMVVSLTDFTFSMGDIKNLTALTLFLYVITTLVYRNRYDKGKYRGREDEDYKTSLGEYRTARGKISELGCASEVPEFCREYKIRELREYREGLLAEVDLNYDDYLSKYRHLSFFDLIRLRLPWDVKMTIQKCNRAKPIKLTPGMILNESGESDRQKLAGQSGRERERKDKRKDFIQRGLMVLLGALIAVDVITSFSFVTIVQWFVRMIPILSALIMGDDSGFCDIAVTETSFKKDQTAIIGLFFEYRDGKKMKNLPATTEDTTTE